MVVEVDARSEVWVGQAFHGKLVRFLGWANKELQRVPAATKSRVIDFHETGAGYNASLGIAHFKQGSQVLAQVFPGSKSHRQAKPGRFSSRQQHG